MPEIILVRAIQTCQVAPCQWDAWDIDGRYWYLRFRNGYGSMSRDYDMERDSALSFYENGSPVIQLEDFLHYLGVTWAPDSRRPGTTWEDPPPV